MADNTKILTRTNRFVVACENHVGFDRFYIYLGEHSINEQGNRSLSWGDHCSLNETLWHLTDIIEELLELKQKVIDKRSKLGNTPIITKKGQRDWPRLVRH